MIGNSRYLLIAMNETFPLHKAAEVFNFATGDKFHIDSGRTAIFEAVARQIVDHKRADPSAVSWHEVRRWAHVLGDFFLVDNQHDKCKALTVRSIETLLQNLVTEIIEEEEESLSAR